MCKECQQCRGKNWLVLRCVKGSKCCFLTRPPLELLEGRCNLELPLNVDDFSAWSNYFWSNTSFVAGYIQLVSCFRIWKWLWIVSIGDFVRIGFNFPINHKNLSVPVSSLSWCSEWVLQVINESFSSCENYSGGIAPSWERAQLLKLGN